jgi:hypothetical protein
MWTEEILSIIAHYGINSNVRGIYNESKIDKISQKIMDMLFKIIPSKYERPVYFFFRRIYFKLKRV